MSNRSDRDTWRIDGGGSLLSIRRICGVMLCVLAACGPQQTDSATDEASARERLPLRFVRTNVIRLKRRAPFSMFQPTFIVKVRSRVFIAESDASRVFTVSPDGSLVEEQESSVPRVLRKDAGAQRWSELANSSAQILSAEARRAIERITDQTRGACLLSDASMLTYENAHSGTVMTRTRYNNAGVATVSNLEVPFFLHHPASWMLREAVWAGDGRQTCVAASIYSYGISVYDGKDAKPRTIDFVEQVGEATVLTTVDTTGPSITTTESVRAPGYGARDIVIRNDSIYVLFVGKSLSASRGIDVYSASQLRYLGTYEHYTRVEAIATSGNEIVLLTKDRKGFLVETGQFLPR